MRAGPTRSGALLDACPTCSPALAELRRACPSVRFTGPLTGERLGEAYAGVDVFVFTSRTDTYGIALLEALASGLPVAACPAAGPVDVIGSSDVSVHSENLRAAALAALNIPREGCRAFALRHSRRASANQFLNHVLTAQRLTEGFSVLAEATAP